MIIAQVFAVIAFIVYSISLQYKEKATILKIQIISNVFYTLEYLMLNAYAGVNNSLFAIVRSLVFYTCDKKKKKLPFSALLIFLLIIIVFGISSYKGLFSVLPVLCSIGFFIILYIDNMKLYRIMAVIASVFFIIYNINVDAYIGIIDSVVELISALIAIYRFDIKKKSKKFGYWEYNKY